MTVLITQSPGNLLFTKLLLAPTLSVAVHASPATSEADKAASAMVDEYHIPFKLAAQLCNV
jgi:hypothetical protein